MSNTILYAFGIERIMLRRSHSQWAWSVGEWLWTTTLLWAITSWVLQNLRAIIADLAGESVFMQLKGISGELNLCTGIYW